MKIRILGPLEVERDGTHVALGPKQQTLLAILLVNRGAAVSADRIVEDLYAGRAPHNALKTLQVHVSRLRKALGDGKLETTPAGYRLASGLGSLDVEQFEELADAGRRLIERSLRVDDWHAEKGWRGRLRRFDRRHLDGALLRASRSLRALRGSARSAPR